MTADAARKLIRKAGKVAGLQFPVHPHMLRHGCGYYLAAKGVDTRAIQDYLGHTNIHHTVRFQGATTRLKWLFYKLYSF
jgi:type 1 fimbriae regulatory protein FimB/type 1 fimbriae regulatory protein FimE